MSLTAKRQLFVNEYVIDWNATQAAIRAGYSPKTAQEQSSRLLSNPEVKVAIDVVRQGAVERCEVTVDKVLADLEETRKKALHAGQYSSAVRASELQGKYLKMFFDGHTVEPSGIEKMTDDELRQRMRQILDADVSMIVQ